MMFYVSLVGPLIGLCLHVSAENKSQVRRWANKELGRLWCDVYNSPVIGSHIMQVVGQTVILGRDYDAE